ncbi:hypothetical protein ASE48_08655 [Mycobacterium sp. Root265]|uniref:hypothetical protein n=1 Tax=Mycobacterium sp. Root265 TaxID=1736504 RepID=UPI000709E762|nr:hypothetical protein [Mycobacterium sp. Root265]KRD08622.1 hypothetical protein ASE48_08655 [Mycobacterium sp. Root265]
MKAGTKVLIQRDEKKYPARGTWKQFRGKKGVITCINTDEFGVSFAPGGGNTDAYFKGYELTERK